MRFAQASARCEPVAPPMSNWPVDILTAEPVYGWMQRAAAENYALSTPGFVEGLGLNGRNWDFDEFLEIAQQLPLSEYSQLEHNTPRRRDDAWEICGHQLTTRFFSKRTRRVCPVCIDESRHIRVWFDIVPIVNCAIHDAQLIAGLPNDPIDWRSPLVAWTRSGVPITKVMASAKQASVLDHYLYNKFNGYEAPCPRHLVAEEVQSVLQAAVCLGKLLNNEPSAVSTQAELRKLAQSGFSPLWQGSEAILESLSQTSWLKGELDEAVLRRRLEHAPIQIQSIPSAALRQLISDCLGVVRVSNRLSVPSGRLARFDGYDGYWSLKSVTENLGMARRHIHKILDTMSNEPTRCPSDHTYRLSNSELQAIESYVAASHSAREVADYLGCDESDIDDLVRRKLLEVDFRIDEARHFKKDAIEALEARALEQKREADHRDATSLCELAQASGISLAEAYSRLVCDEDVIFVDYDQSKPLFRGAMVVEAVRVSPCTGKTTRPKAQIRNDITIAAAAARLGTSWRGVQQLIALSYLEATKGGSGQPSVSEASLDDFETKFARAALYCNLLDCHPTWALKLLRKLGVQPINEGRTRFVSREEVARITGLELEGRTGLPDMEILHKAIEEGIVCQSVPATACIIADPAIVIRATTARWTIRVEQLRDPGQYLLSSHFRKKQEPARLQRILAAEVDPEEIWPGGFVSPEAKGGFTLVDEIDLPNESDTEKSRLVERCLERALELHRLL